MQASLLAQGPSGQHNFNRGNAGSTLSGRAANSSVSSLNAGAGTSQMQQLTQQQHHTTSSGMAQTRSKKGGLVARSPEISSAKKAIMSGGGNKTTTLAFEAWVNSICPSGSNSSQTQRKNNAKVISKAQHMAPKPHAQAFSSVTSHSTKVNEDVDEQEQQHHIARAGLSEQVSEVSQMNASGGYQPQLDTPMSTSDLYRGTFHSQVDYDDSMASQVMTTTEDVDFEATDLGAKSAMQTQKVPQSHVELEKINLQLAEEYKYVENLRRNLRQAELRHQEVLLKHEELKQQDFMQRSQMIQTQVNSENSQPSGRKNAMIGRASTLQIEDLRDSSEASLMIKSTDFWSEAQLARAQAGKFQMEPPSKQLREDAGTKAQNTRKVGGQRSLHKKGVLSGSDYNSNGQDLVTPSSSGKSIRNLAQENFGQSSSIDQVLPSQSSAQVKRSAQFGQDEYRSNTMRRISAKKIQSPNMKGQSNIAQRFINQDFQHYSSRPTSNLITSPTHLIQSTGKKFEDSTETPTSSQLQYQRPKAVHASAAKRLQHPLTSTAKSQQSFIGSGIFKKGNAMAQSDRIGAGLVSEAASSVMKQPSQPSGKAANQGSGNMEACHAFQGSNIGFAERLFHSQTEHKAKAGTRTGDETTEDRLQENEANKRSEMLTAPYDFDKYEMMSTSHQIQDLLSKKLDTPKGSSDSQGSNDEDELNELPEQELVEEDQIQGRPTASFGANQRPPHNSLVVSQQTRKDTGQESHSFVGTSPEPTRKLSNSLFSKQRTTTDKKISATAHALKVNEIKSAKQVQSPTSRNRQAMHAPLPSSQSVQGMPTQQHVTTGSFLASYHQNEAAQSPSIKQKHARFEQTVSQTSIKRPNMFMRGNQATSSTSAINQHSQQNTANTALTESNANGSVNNAAGLSGGPAVPGIRKTQRVAHKSNNSSGIPATIQSSQAAQGQPENRVYYSQSVLIQEAGQGGRSSLASNRRTRITSPNAQELLHSPVMTKQQSDGNSFVTVRQATQTAPSRKQQIESPRKATEQGRQSPRQKVPPALQHANSTETQNQVAELTIDVVLRFLLEEEEWLDHLQDMAGTGNFLEMQAQGLLLPRYDPDQRIKTLYASLFSSIQLSKQRPRVFAMQLYIYVKSAVLITEILVLDPTSMRKFASKLDDVLKNCHQNFLLMIDFIVSGITQPQMKKSVDYKLLRSVISKKLDPANARNRLTTFRQKNELSRAFLKRIACELTDLPISKQAAAVQKLCSGVLETLKMTIEENGMDVTKNQANHKRIITQLDRIYELALEATRAMKMASKKAHMKKNQQHERKVKSVMRGQKAPYQSNSAQKNVSPPPKRYRGQQQQPVAQMPNALESRLQGHLFGVKQQDTTMTSHNQSQQQYLHTVEETEHTEASPAKSLLQLESQPTELSPPKVEPEKPVSAISTNFDESCLAIHTSSTSFVDEAPLKKGAKTTRRRTSPSNNATSKQSWRRISQLTQPSGGESSVKHVKTTLTTSKRQSNLGTSRNSSRSPPAQTNQRKMSPIQQQEEQAKQLQSIVLQQNQQQQQDLNRSSLLPESVAFVMANSNPGKAGSGASLSPKKTFTRTSNINLTNVQRTFSLNLVQTETQKPGGTLTKHKSLNAMPMVDTGFTKQILGRFQQREAPTTTSHAKINRRGTLQKTKSTQSQHMMGFQLYTTRPRLNTVATQHGHQGSHGQLDSRQRRSHQQRSSGSSTNVLQTAKAASGSITAKGLTKSNNQKSQLEETKDEAEMLPSQSSAVFTVASVERPSEGFKPFENREGSPDGPTDSRRSELPARSPLGGDIIQSASMSAPQDQEADANPFGQSVGPEEPQVVAFSLSEENEENKIDPEEKVELISSAIKTITPVRESQHSRDDSKGLDDDEVADFSLTPNLLRDDSRNDVDQVIGDEDDEDDDDDLDEDGSLILGRSSSSIPPSFTSIATRQSMSAAVGAAITPREPISSVTESVISAQREKAAKVAEDSIPRTKPFDQSQKDSVLRESPFDEVRAHQDQPSSTQSQILEQHVISHNCTAIVPQMHRLDNLDQLDNNSFMAAVEQDRCLTQRHQAHPEIQPSMPHRQESQLSAAIKRQVGPFDKSILEPSDEQEEEVKLKFEASNFVTPTQRPTLPQTNSTDSAKAPSPEKQTEATPLQVTPLHAQRDVTSSTVTYLQHAPPRILLEQADDDDEEEKADFDEDGDGTMKEYVEDLLSGQLMAGRRSSSRVNSLLFEEDSMQIKREMLRQKQEKQRINMEQRISLKFTNGALGARRTTARRLTSSHVLPAPSTARNTISQFRKTSSFPSPQDEVFGTLSTNLNKNQNQIRSHSLIELDSAEEEMKSSSKYTSHADADNAEAHLNSTRMSGGSIHSSGPNSKAAPIVSMQDTNLALIGVKERESVGLEKTGSQNIFLNTPMTPKEQSFNAAAAVVAESVAETPQSRQTKIQAQNEITPTNDQQTGVNKPSSKGAKSAANADLMNFYQSLIPQNSQEKDNDGANELPKSRSMVTNFLEIPDPLPIQDEKDEATGADPRNSFGYSNQGTFQTPERDRVGRNPSLSPSNNLFRGDTIHENSAEEEPESPDMNLPTRQNSLLMRRQESHKTSGFESIDSFVQLENQLLTRGDSLVKESSMASQDVPTRLNDATTIQEEATIDEYDYQNDSSAIMPTEIDDEQEAIEAELAILRTQVKIPYLPPIDTTMIDESEVYTLVLDLDETLIHYECDDEDGDYYLIRPGAIRFLKELALYYEIVIFTAAMPEYADKIVDNLDENGFMIKHRLYRQHTTPTEDYAIKDLRLLGRKLERTIIVDNLAENFQATTPNNGVWVESWYDDMQDQVLPRLSKFLAELVEEQVPDVRRFLTQEIKDEVIYACLESNMPIPPLSEISRRFVSQFSLDR